MGASQQRENVNGKGKIDERRGEEKGGEEGE